MSFYEDATQKQIDDGAGLDIGNLFDEEPERPGRGRWVVHLPQQPAEAFALPTGAVLRVADRFDAAENHVGYVNIVIRQAFGIFNVFYPYALGTLVSIGGSPGSWEEILKRGMAAVDQALGGAP